MNAARQIIDVRVPDIGDFDNIPVIEVLVKPGDLVAAEEPIVTLESEKATLDVPAPLAGRVVTVDVAAGTRVSCGALLLTLSVAAEVQVAAALPAQMAASTVHSAGIPGPTGHVATDLVRWDWPALALAAGIPSDKSPRIYASPAVRRMGRELGVNLAGLKGSGRAGRILKQDVHGWVREKMTSPVVPQSPTVDFARFGAVERQPLSRIRRISGPVLARNWGTIPHVTNFDEADITDLERFRIVLNEERRGEPKISIVTFLVKACASALKSMPALNASLDGQSLVLKKYVHIGFAVDTPAGLLVPVLRNSDQLGLLDIASALAVKATAAREGKLKVEDMEGGCFSISSLGGIGGGTFTPIINAPEVAILGAGKAKIQGQWDGTQFLPRLMLPLSLSWDHRALDGATAARFLTHLVNLLQDLRRVLL